MSEFEEKIVQHVLDRILVEIDKGETVDIWFTTYNTDGSSSTQQRQVNVKSSLISAVIQGLLTNAKFNTELEAEFEKLLGDEDFIKKVAEAQAEKLLEDLNTKTSWYPAEKYANRDSFKEKVRQATIKIIAQRKADEMLKEPDDAKDSE